MDKNWIKVYETSLLHKAEIVKAVLIDHQIEAVILNRQSSSHISLNTGNDVEVYVQNTSVIEAKHLLAKHNL